MPLVAVVVFAHNQATAEVWLNVVVLPAFAKVSAPPALPNALHRTEPDGGVGVRGFFRPGAEDDALEEKPAGGGGEVEHAFVTEEFPQVAPDIGHGRGVG